MDNLRAEPRDTATVHGIAPHERPALCVFEPSADAPAEGIQDEGLEPRRKAGRFGSSDSESMTIAAAVNCFPTDPNWYTVRSVAGT
jgi:hypothetical protein